MTCHGQNPTVLLYTGYVNWYCLYGCILFIIMLLFFCQVMETVRLQENMREDFPVTMGVNAFRGFMNEFMNSRLEQEKPRKTKRKKEKKRKTEDPIIYRGHHFILTIINIPTACEICSSFFMWPIERGLVCQSNYRHYSFLNYCYVPLKKKVFVNHCIFN